MEELEEQKGSQKMAIYLQIGSFQPRPHRPKDPVATASRGNLLFDRPDAALGEPDLPGRCDGDQLRRRLTCSWFLKVVAIQVDTG